jgi:hypothetical protein
LAELKEMGAKLSINSGGELLAQLLVRLTYREQILQTQFHDNKAGVETQFWVADDGTTVVCA